LTGQKPGLNCLGPITNQAQMLHLVKLLTAHPFLARGVLEAKENSSNILQRSTTSLYPRTWEYLTGGYTSYDFVTASHTRASQRLCIHPPR